MAHTSCQAAAGTVGLCIPPPHPLALAEAFRRGTIGVMDYYRMENVQADTTMRRSLAEADSTA